MIDKRPASANDLLFGFLTAIVLLAPLPLASNRAWSWSLLSLLVGATACTWCLFVYSGKARTGLPLRKLLVPASLYGLAIAWAWLQTVPGMPADWVHPIWKEAETALQQSLSTPVSVDSEKTRHAIMRLMAYGLIFLLATQLGRKRQRAELGLRWVAFGILLYGFAALVTYLLGIEYLLWVPKWAYEGDATGTFVGRAAFGAFAGIGVLACLAQAARHVKGGMPGTRMSDRLERMLTGMIPWLLGAGLLLTAVLASHSRGALLVTIAASILLFIAFGVGRQLRLGQAAVMVVVLYVLVGGALAVFGQETLTRMAGEGDLTGDRPNLLRLTWTAIWDAPLTGFGLGTFEWAFHPYRDLSLPRDVIYDYAHSSWLETIMDLGWPAGSCLIAALVWICGTCICGLFRRREDQVYPALAIAAASLLGLQAFIDFTIQIPALAALLSYLLGLGYSQSWSSR